MTMTHPGLPLPWVIAVAVLGLLASFWLLLSPLPAGGGRPFLLHLARLPFIGNSLRRLLTRPWLLLSLKLVMVALFLLVIYAGLFGTRIPERNLATVLTWNVWWSGLIFSVFFLGSAWCAVCPWDALAQWLVRRKLWRRAEPNNSLNLTVPKWLRSVWPALFLFVALTWLELGVGITLSPYATAILSLLMVVMATVSLSLFQRKAFCRYFCPVGRTVGAYSQLSMVELRPIAPDVCASCTTLECYHGNAEVEPCPTSLVMGRLEQNSYCTSCGNCSRSCPQQNVAWRFRSPSIEAMQTGRPHWDEAWFMLGLLALTGFHGLTMMSFWEDWMRNLAQRIGDSGQLLASFSIGLVGILVAVFSLYSLSLLAIQQLLGNAVSFRRLFASFSFTALPLAFSYHMAHNLNHLVREGSGLGDLFLNPLGTNTLPLSMQEKHMRHLSMWISQDALFTIQAVLMLLGFLVAMQVIRHRGQVLLGSGQQSAWKLAPMLAFVITMTAFHLWMLMQPMTMRM